MNVLITGACGFIGSNLTRALCSDNRIKKIILLDNLSTGFKKNIENFLSFDKVVFFENDIRNFDICLDIVSQVDVVCHQAALGSVPRSIDDPITSNDNNVTGFLNLITASAKCKISKFIFAASSSTYGDSITLPKVEDIIGKPLSPYAVTKYVNELYADAFYRCYGLNYIGLRYFNVFGPNQDPNSSYSAVIPKFCKSILNGENIILNGDGKISRDFTFIDNVVKANILSIFTENEAALNQIYNVACGEMFSIKELAENLISISGSNVNILHGPPRKGDIQYSKASIEKINSLLGYLPDVNFLQGLEFTWNYYKSLSV